MARDVTAPVSPRQVLIRQIESSDDLHAISGAISNLLSLTQDGPQLCSIIAKVTPPRPVRVGAGRCEIVLKAL